MHSMLHGNAGSPVCDPAGCCWRYCRSLPVPRSGFELQPLAFEGSTGFTIETSTLFGVLNEARVHKTQQEVEVLQYVSDVGSRAHVAMMQVRAVLLLPLLLLSCCSQQSVPTWARGVGQSGNVRMVGWPLQETVSNHGGLSNTWLCL